MSRMTICSRETVNQSPGSSKDSLAVCVELRKGEPDQIFGATGRWLATTSIAVPILLVEIFVQGRTIVAGSTARGRLIRREWSSPCKPDPSSLDGTRSSQQSSANPVTGRCTPSTKRSTATFVWCVAAAPSVTELWCFDPAHLCQLRHRSVRPSAQPSKWSIGCGLRITAYRAVLTRAGVANDARPATRRCPFEGTDAMGLVTSGQPAEDVAGQARLRRRPHRITDSNGPSNRPGARVTALPCIHALRPQLDRDELMRWGGMGIVNIGKARI